MLIVGNSKSILTIKLSKFFSEEYQVDLINENIDFSHRNFFSALKEVKKILSCNKYDILVLYQLNLTAFVATLANRRKKIPAFAIGIGSDILTMPKKGWAYKTMLKYILKHSQAYNAGSPYLLEQMQKYCPKNSEILLANLGINPIQAQKKEKFQFFLMLFHLTNICSHDILYAEQQFGLLEAFFWMRIKGIIRKDIYWLSLCIVYVLHMMRGEYYELLY